MRRQRRTLTVRWLARWLLLACTLVGLAAMHSLGHGGGAHATAMLAHASHSAVTMSPDTGCGSDSCAHLTSSPAGGGHDIPGWSVCLAIVGGIAVILLLGAALLPLARRADPAGVLLGRVGTDPRAPPGVSPVGLALATVSVLRR